MDYAIFEKIDSETFHVKFSPKLPDSVDFARYLDYLTDILIDNKGIYMIFDASYASYIPTELRKMQANWIKEHKTQIITAVFCNIYVIPNAIQRSVLNAIYLIQRPVVPYKIVTSYKQALEYLIQLKATIHVA